MTIEFIAYSIIITKVLWVKIFLENFKLDQIVDSKVKLLHDNQMTISIVKNGEVRPSKKYIELQYHYILYMIQMDELNVNCIPVKKIFVDSLIKPINIENFRKYVMLWAWEHIKVIFGFLTKWEMLDIVAEKSSFNVMDKFIRNITYYVALDTHAHKITLHFMWSIYLIIYKYIFFKLNIAYTCAFCIFDV